MNEQAGLPFLREVILFLALAGILIPVLQRLHINPVFGFLAVGSLVGPFGLGTLAQDYPWVAYFTFPRLEGVIALAELGVLFLMFSIGLELSFERLWAMRKWVFGAGTAQVLLSGLAIGAVARAFGNSVESSAILGLALSFSSTAVVMQLLTQRRELGTPLGRASFSVLLLQDLAVVPLLVLVGILGRNGGDLLAMAGLAAIKGIGAILVIYLIGKRVIRPAFLHLVAPGQPDSFMALTLLSTLGIAALTWLAGLSMALGAFLAGLLLSETEYRHEVEVTIDPFKGLFMGLFFFSVGMGVDLRALVREPMWLPLSVIGLFAIKTVILAAVLRLFGLPGGRAIEGGLLLGQGGEFAFVVIGSAMLFKLIEREVGHFMLLVVGLTLFATPLLARAGQLAGESWDRYRERRYPYHEVETPVFEGHVVIAGFGRVGQMLGQLLEQQNIPYVVLEANPRLASNLYATGKPVYYGDASRPELLRRVGVDRASAVVLTMDHTAAALRAVQAIRREYPHIKVFARARDEKHALSLKEAGASAVIPETLESSLRLGAFVLMELGLPEDVAERVVQQERESRITAFESV